MNKRLGHGIAAVLRFEVDARVVRIEGESFVNESILIGVFLLRIDIVGCLAYHFHFYASTVFLLEPILIVYRSYIHVWKNTGPGAAVVHVVGKYIFVGLSEVVGEQDAYLAVLAVELLAGFPSDSDIAAYAIFVAVLLECDRIYLERISLHDVELHAHGVVARVVVHGGEEGVAARGRSIRASLHKVLLANLLLA